MLGLVLRAGVQMEFSRGPCTKGIAIFVVKIRDAKIVLMKVKDD